MKTLMLLIAFTFIFTSCKNEKEVDKIMDTLELDTSKSLLEIGCYTYRGNNSTITFEITDIKKFVTGNLNYHLAEKDANTGTFEGVLLDDILLGDYTFQSEGTTSRREVIFKIVNHQLMEGYGRMDDEGICFVNTDHVTFSSTMPLTKTHCK